MKSSRRSFLHHTVLGATGASLLTPGHALFGASETKSIRIGSCSVGLLEAKQAGLEGAELRVGNAADRLDIADPAIRQTYKDQMRETGLPVASLMMGLLNSNPLATEPRAPAWLEQSIEGAKDLGAKVILVAFFSKGNLLDDNKQLKKADVDEVVKRLKVAAPLAKAAGITLAIENLLSAQQNLEILDRIGHESVQIYYDVFNLAGQGYDVLSELRLLRQHIVSIHFKNGPRYLDDGQVKFPPVVDVIQEIGYQGWIILETSSPSKDKVADAKRNADYVRKLFAS